MRDNKVCVIAKNIKQGDEIIIPSLNIKFSKQKINNIVGKNGIGKSTLLSAMAGELNCEYLKIYDNQNEINPYKNYDIIKISSDFFGYEYLTSIELVEYILRIYKEEVDKGITCGKYLMDILNMKKYENTLVKNLSQGTKQKLAFISAAVTNCGILLFDESFEHIDQESIHVIKEILDREMVKRCVISVSHTNILQGLSTEEINLEEKVNHYEL